MGIRTFALLRYFTCRSGGSVSFQVTLAWLKMLTVMDLVLHFNELEIRWFNSGRRGSRNSSHFTYLFTFSICILSIKKIIISWIVQSLSHFTSIKIFLDEYLLLHLHITKQFIVNCFWGVDYRSVTDINLLKIYNSHFISLDIFCGKYLNPIS